MAKSKDPFSKAKTPAEIYSIRKKLIDSGMDSTEVNKMAMQRKRQLIESINEVRTLERVIPSASVNSGSKTSSLNVSYDLLTTGCIKVQENLIIV